MNEREQREEELFDAARQLNDAGQRAAFLDAACAGAGELRARVEDLLAAQAEADLFFRPVARPGDSVSAVLPAEPVGTVIGRYKLLEKIGEGGMGVVYMAEQQEPVRRRVALKIIKLGMDTHQVVARFEAERQALALMDHPNIAKVLDGGATDPQISNLKSGISLGRPYFVMELVAGVPITEFCAKNRLSVEERLRLLIPVCQAVQHAHQKGIIHRDLKPSNVLVTLHDGVPVPKVIDFGVAKATNQRLTEKTFFTQHATMIGTPAYMSPEQAEMSGLDVDTRSDIYSLGVLLYELLTGTQPFPEQQLRSVAFAEMQRIILHEAPERPSTRLRKTAGATSSPLLATRYSQFASDLDWIVLKCLEKDRNRRYETANGLAADLKRFLGSEPVVARPPNAAYRVRKFVRRHRAASLATALIALTMVAGGVVSGWALARERVARGNASELLTAALRFADRVVNNVAPELENLTGATPARNALSQASVEFLKHLPTDATEDPNLRVALARALVLFSSVQNPGGANTVGDYQVGLDRAGEAVQLLSAPTPQLTEPERLNLLMSARFAVIMCLYGLGRWDQAIAGSGDLEPLFDQLDQVPDRALWSRRQRVNVRSNSAYATFLAGRPQEAVERLEGILGSDWVCGLSAASSGDDLELLANLRESLAAAQGLLRQFEAMTTNAAAGDRVWEQLVTRFPRNARYQAGRVEGWSLRGWALVATGRAEEGFALLERSRREIASLVETDPANDQFQTTRAVTAATQAMACVTWSADRTAPSAERRRRWDQGERYLAEAEQFNQFAKSKEAAARLALARAAVAAAKRGVESQASEALGP